MKAMSLEKGQKSTLVAFEQMADEFPQIMV
jgi:hypothetical protein